MFESVSYIHHSVYECFSFKGLTQVSSEYFDFREGIENPDIFSPPAACNRPSNSTFKIKVGAILSVGYVQVKHPIKLLKSILYYKKCFIFSSGIIRSRIGIL